MTLRRVHTSALDALGAQATLGLDEEAAHYVRDVLRLEPGDEVELFDGAGLAARGQIASCDRRAVIVRLMAPPEPSEAGEPGQRVILASAMPKGERWEWLVEKATEAGVAEIIPLHTARGVVQIAANKTADKVARWDKIAAGAARQCRRARAPVIHEPASIKQAAEAVKRVGALMLVPHTAGATRSLAAAAREATSGQPICVWIGPEGGWAEDELALLEAAGAACVHMGPRIFRAETAAIVACALIQSVSGDLQ